jgi:hypothetical protein
MSQAAPVRMAPRHVDSVEKLLCRLSLLAKVAVSYNGKRITVAPSEHILLSPSLLRSFRCHVGCTACCGVTITLDFTEAEFQQFVWSASVDTPAREGFSKRRIAVNGETFTIMTFPQYKYPSCPFLRPTREGGAYGCGFWTATDSTQPLECHAAPQISITERGKGITVIAKRPFGRAWQWKVTPQCEFDSLIDGVGDLDRAVDLADEIDTLQRYQHWADMLHVPTYIPEIIAAMHILKDTCKQKGVHLVQVI